MTKTIVEESVMPHKNDFSFDEGKSFLVEEFKVNDNLRRRYVKLVDQHGKFELSLSQFKWIVEKVNCIESEVNVCEKQLRL
jgi:hypothetical protein